MCYLSNLLRLVKMRFFVRCFSIFNDAIFNDVSKNCKTSCKRCILTMFLQRTVKCEEKNIYLNTFFLQIGYTEEIRAVNYQFFVQKSAQYRHKCLRKGLHQTKTCTMKPQTS